MLYGDMTFSRLPQYHSFLHRPSPTSYKCIKSMVVMPWIGMSHDDNGTMLTTHWRQSSKWLDKEGKLLDLLRKRLREFSEKYYHPSCQCSEPQKCVKGDEGTGAKDKHYLDFLRPKPFRMTIWGDRIRPVRIFSV